MPHPRGNSPHRLPPTAPLIAERIFWRKPQFTPGPATESSVQLWNKGSSAMEDVRCEQRFPRGLSRERARTQPIRATRRLRAPCPRPALSGPRIVPEVLPTGMLRSVPEKTPRA